MHSEWFVASLDKD